MAWDVDQQTWLHEFQRSNRCICGLPIVPVLEHARRPSTRPRAWESALP